MNNTDKTLTRNYLKHIKGVIVDYELTKAHKHPSFKFTSDVFKHHKIPKQNFFKIYNRWKINNQDSSLLPQKRGRKYGVLKAIPMIINKVLELRKQGFGRYEIYDLLEPKYGRFTPKPSTIYKILKRNGLNKFFKVNLDKKRKIVKDTLGELGHMDCHQVKRGTVMELGKQMAYLIAIVDDHSRVCAVDVIDNIQSITTMMATMKLLSVIWQNYSFKFTTIMTDNGSEFKGAYEQLLKELKIKQIKTRPYHPQTNGKVERFWRTLEQELLEEKTYQTVDELKEDLFNYMIYYNHIRHHQGIGKKPIDLLKVMSTK